MTEPNIDQPMSSHASRQPRASRWLGAVVIVVLIVGWFGYLRWVSGVLAHEEKYPNGKVKAAGFLKRTGWSDYKRHGLWTTYYPDEKMASQGHYDMGSKVGEWSYWNESGERVAKPTSTEADN